MVFCPKEKTIPNLLYRLAPLNMAHCAAQAGEHIEQGTEDRRVLAMSFYSNWVKTVHPKPKKEQETSDLVNRM